MYIYIIPALIAVLIITVLVRAYAFKNGTNAENPGEIEVDEAEAESAQKLSEAIRLKTVSHIEASLTDWDEFREFHALLERLFPNIHAACEKTVIQDYSLVFRWKGANPSMKPGLITAHMDVVPVEKGTEADWEHPPFSGDIAEGFVWGRGALDTKIHLIASLEAAEQLIGEGFVPDRDIYFAFGHDEEIGGQNGAQNIAKHFREMDIEFEYLLDEGGCITEGVVGEIARPLAMIGIGEKGFNNIKLTFKGEGGHSSMPPRHSALGLAALAISRLEKRQFRLRLIKPFRMFLMKTGPEMGFVNRLVLANLWLFEPLFLKVFSKSRSGNAMLRTTTAATMAEGSIAPNVLPQKASVVVNFRILPGETVEDLLEHIKKALGDIEAEIEPLILENPSTVSSCDSEAYKSIAAITGQLCGDAIVVPYIVLAGTDARKYESVCRNIYRFTPYRINSRDMDRIHSTNERISLKNVNMCVEFFRAFFSRRDSERVSS